MSTWDGAALWLKAKAFFERANAVTDRSDSDYPLWSIMSLELLARSALATVHPILNADFRNEASILFAFGGPSSKAKSVVAAHAFDRLRILGKLSNEDVEFCKRLIDWRNEDLHTAGVPFDNLKERDWLPHFYAVCEVLSAPKTLEHLLGTEVGAYASSLVAARKEAIVKEVLDLISKHKREFERRRGVQKDLSLGERVSARLRHRGMMAGDLACPACGCKGMVFGTAFREIPPTFVPDTGTLYITTEHQSEVFECQSCELSLVGLSAIVAAGLEPSFSASSQQDFAPIEPEYEYGDM